MELDRENQRAASKPFHFFVTSAGLRLTATRLKLRGNSIANMLIFQLVFSYVTALVVLLMQATVYKGRRENGRVTVKFQTFCP